MFPKFRQEYDGVWFRPKMREWFMRCCSCSLVHRVDFRITKRGQVEMRVWNLGKHKHVP